MNSKGVICKYAVSGIIIQIRRSGKKAIGPKLQAGPIGELATEEKNTYRAETCWDNRAEGMEGVLTHGPRPGSVVREACWGALGLGEARPHSRGDEAERSCSGSRENVLQACGVDGFVDLEVSASGWLAGDPEGKWRG